MKIPEIYTYTEHDVKMAFNDGYQEGYEVGLEKASKDGTMFLCSVISTIFGLVIGVALCKFVPGLLDGIWSLFT